MVYQQAFSLRVSRQRFVRYVGSLYSRKLGRLLEAFVPVARHFEPHVCILVIVGGRASMAAGEVTLAERVARLGLEKSVLRTGPLSAEEIPPLISMASVFAYVSFFEGFGLMPLEAIACGAPVIALNTPSLPEVVGDAGVLVDPLDTETITRAIIRVLEDSAYEALLRVRSIARASEFSWERTARETFTLYSSQMARSS